MTVGLALAILLVLGPLLAWVLNLLTVAVPQWVRSFYMAVVVALIFVLLIGYFATAEGSLGSQ